MEALHQRLDLLYRIHPGDRAPFNRARNFVKQLYKTIPDVAPPAISVQDGCVALRWRHAVITIGVGATMAFWRDDEVRIGDKSSFCRANISDRDAILALLSLRT